MKNRMKILSIVVVTMWMSVGIFANAAYGKEANPDIQRVFWDYKPMKITLQVGKERVIFFPPGTHVRVYRPASLTDVLRHQSVDNVVYWKANKAFDTTRITVQNIKTNDTYLIDLSASKHAQSNVPVQIVSRIPNKDDAGKQGADAKEQVNTAPAQKKEYGGVVALTRYASQQLYAPKRVLVDINERIPGVMRTQVPTDTYYKLYKGAFVTARPIAGWKNNRYYVTAVKLTNKTDTAKVLDPRNIRGTFKTATFQFNPPVLAPSGQPNDTTTVYLVSADTFLNSTQYVQKVAKPGKAPVPKIETSDDDLYQ